MLCEATAAAGSGVNALALFVALAALLSLSFGAFVLGKYQDESRPTQKLFAVRWGVQVLLTHLGAVFVGLTLLEGEISQCSVNALSVLAPGLLILPPAVRVFNYKQQSLLTQTAAEDAGAAAKDAFSSPRGSFILLTNSRLIVSRFKSMFRFVRAVLTGKLRRADFDVETLRLLRNAGSGNLAMRLLVVTILPFLITCVILAAESASVEVVRGIRWVAYSVCLILLALVLVRAWSLPDPFHVVREVKVASLAFLPPLVVLVLLDRSEAMIPALLYCLSQSVFTPLCVLVSNAHRRRVLAKWQKPEFASPTEEFDNLLGHAALHHAFFQHLATEHSVDSLIFYDEINKWTKEYHDMGARTAYIRAKKIVQCYVGDEAMFPVNLPGQLIVKLRSEVDPLFGAQQKRPTLQQQRSLRRLRPPALDVSMLKTSSVQDVVATPGVEEENGSWGADPLTPKIGELEPASPVPPLTPSTARRNPARREPAKSIFRVRFASLVEDSATNALEEAVVPVERPERAETVSIDFFLQAEREIKLLMRMDGFNRFKRTKTYHELLIAQAEENHKRAKPVPDGSGLFQNLIRLSKE